MRPETDTSRARALLADPRVRIMLATMGHPLEGPATPTASMLTCVEGKLEDGTAVERERAARIVLSAWECARLCSRHDYRVTAVLGTRTQTMLVGRETAASRDEAMHRMRDTIVAENPAWRAASYEIEEV